LERLLAKAKEERDNMAIDLEDAKRRLRETGAPPTPEVGRRERDAAKQLAAKDREIATLKDAVKKLEHELEEAKHQADKLKSDLDEEAKIRVQEAEEAEAEIKDLQDTIKKLRQENERLDDKLDELRKAPGKVLAAPSKFPLFVNSRK
jgi:chromosome segregation ATPase